MSYGLLHVFYFFLWQWLLSGRIKSIFKKEHLKLNRHIYHYYKQCVLKQQMSAGNCVKQWKIRRSKLSHFIKMNLFRPFSFFAKAGKNSVITLILLSEKR